MEQPRAMAPAHPAHSTQHTADACWGSGTRAQMGILLHRQTDSSKDTEHSCSKIQQGSYSILREVESVTGEGHVREEKDREGPS